MFLTLDPNFYHLDEKSKRGLRRATFSLRYLPTVLSFLKLSRAKDGVSRFSPPIDRDISLNFPPIWQVLSLQISVHRNFPTYLPNYFGHLKSLFSCKYHYLWVMCKFCKKNNCFHQDSNLFFCMGIPRSTH